ncbi:MAG: ABC transporter permease [Oscillospiraceae bacterium]|nr:ABC transporter permease [Oscillospiraceae bacterium]
MRQNGIDMYRVSNFFIKNCVTVLFVILCIIALYITTFSPTFILEEIFMRMGRSTLLVLSLLIPVIAGLGLNFGIVVGAIAAQAGIFIAVFFFQYIETLFGEGRLLGFMADFAGIGFIGFLIAFAVATPLAILFGFLVGKLFNKMKGTEMIGGLVAGFFSDGLYQFFFLFVMGGLFTVDMMARLFPDAALNLILPTGVGVMVNINLQGNIAGAVDNVSMLRIVDAAFYVVSAVSAVMLIYRFVTKKALGLLKIAKVFVPVAILWGASHIFPAVEEFLLADRLRLIYAVEWTAFLVAAISLWRIIQEKALQKKEGVPLRPILYLAAAALVYGITWHPAVYTAFMHVRLPVLTFLLIIGTCFFIRWFLNTRLGQNMRTVGQDRAVATSAGINVNRVRIIAIIMSTTLACWGQLIFLQNMGTMAMYGAHPAVGLYTVAALLVGGASVQSAGIKNALLGVVLFHTLIFLAPNVGAQLMGDSQHGEFFRLFITYGVVAISLALYAWSRIKTASSAAQIGDPAPDTGGGAQES